MDLESGAVVGVTMQAADTGDTTSMVETLIVAAEQVEAVQPDNDRPEGAGPAQLHLGAGPGPSMPEGRVEGPTATTKTSETARMVRAVKPRSVTLASGVWIANGGGVRTTERSTDSHESASTLLALSGGSTFVLIGLLALGTAAAQEIGDDIEVWPGVVHRVVAIPLVELGGDGAPEHRLTFPAPVHAESHLVGNVTAYRGQCEETHGEANEHIDGYPARVWFYDGGQYSINMPERSTGSLLVNGFQSLMAAVQIGPETCVHLDWNLPESRRRGRSRLRTRRRTIPSTSWICATCSKTSRRSIRRSAGCLTTCESGATGGVDPGDRIDVHRHTRIGSLMREA